MLRIAAAPAQSRPKRIPIAGIGRHPDEYSSLTHIGCSHRNEGRKLPGQRFPLGG